MPILPSASRYLSRGGATFLLPDYDAWDTWGGLASIPYR